MSTKLSAANPYLRDRAMRGRTIMESATTSSAIEGIRTLFTRRAHDGAVEAEAVREDLIRTAASNELRSTNRR